MIPLETARNPASNKDEGRRKARRLPPGPDGNGAGVFPSNGLPETSAHNFRAWRDPGNKLNPRDVRLHRREKNGCSQFGRLTKVTNGAEMHGRLMNDVVNILNKCIICLKSTINYI